MDSNSTSNSLLNTDTVTDSESDSKAKFSIKFSPSFGRYLVASEAIDSHELLIDEKPVVVAPSGEYDINPTTQRPQPICIGCLKSQNYETIKGLKFESEYSTFSEDLSNYSICPKFQKCPSCSWPICESKCPGIDNFHSTEECGLFRSKGIIQSPRSLRMVYLIRCCLMAQTNPENWKKLLQLTSSAVSVTQEIDPGSDSTTNSELNPFLGQDEQDYRFLIDVCGFDPQKIPKLLVFRINGVRRVNGFGFYNTELDTVRFYGMALYFMASMASHGCTPNMTTQVVYDPRESFPMRFRTKMEVKPGQLLKIAYRSYWLELGTLRRREKIFQDHKFLCQCDRCEDPRENGTNFSSIKCDSCLSGYLLPEVPLDLDSLWKCEDCSNAKTEQEITNILESITDEIERTLQSEIKENNENKNEDEIGFELENEYLKQINLESENQRKFQQLTVILSGKAKYTLHENHYLIMRAEVEWIRHFPFEILQQQNQEIKLGIQVKASEQVGSEMDDLQKIWNLFVLLVERGEHCKRVYSKIIPDWAEKNHFIDIAIGRAYQTYYLDHLISIPVPNCGPQQDAQNISNFHPDLLLDLMKINLKYFQNGLRFEDPFSNLALIVRNNCNIIQDNISQLLGACD